MKSEEEMKKCDHEPVYRERDVSGESIFEEYTCRKCGVDVVFEYHEPDKKTVEYPSGETEVIGNDE